MLRFQRALAIGSLLAAAQPIVSKRLVSSISRSNDGEGAPPSATSFHFAFEQERSSGAPDASGFGLAAGQQTTSHPENRRHPTAPAPLEDDLAIAADVHGDEDNESDEVAGFGNTARQANDEDEVEEGTMPGGEELLSDVPEYVLQRRGALFGASPEDLVETVTHYLRATENVRLVVAEDEHIIFSVVLERLSELHVAQLLDIVECHWARSTLVRYGIDFKDRVRDRIADIANAAAEASRRTEEARSQGSVDDGDSHRDPAASGKDGAAAEQWGEDNEGEDDGVGDQIYAAEETALQRLKQADPILAAADRELDPQTVLRCIVVMGMSAGRRKRDLDFFSVLGSFLAHNINHYKDPHDLVHVLTAFSRAKIVPSPSFLALLSRRFPVISKKIPLEPLPCYRAMVNFARMGHENMSTYRFFADYMLTNMETKIAEEKVSAQQRSQAAAVAATEPLLMQSCRQKATMLSQLPVGVAERERLRKLSGLTPTMLTRWLLVLARHGAPHQQYLRPLIKPVVVPMLPYLPPPSFSRLLLAMRFFKTSDLELTEPVIDVLCQPKSCCDQDASAVAEKIQGDTLLLSATTEGRRSSAASLVDVLAMLSILAKPDTPIPQNMDQFLLLCQSLCDRGLVTTTSHPPENSNKATGAADDCGLEENTAGDDENRNEPVPFVLRPTDMCAVANCLLQLQRKPEIPLEALEPLTNLMEAMAERLAYLMELHVVSLTHVDLFADICAQQQHPDVSGSIARLRAARHAIAENSTASPGGVGDDGEGTYYSALDIDVRDTFFRILVVNGTNTYGAYRPLPGPLQLDFRDWLTKVSAVDLLEAADLHERACPGALRATPERFLSRSVLEKLGTTGEEVINAEAHRLELRPPRELLLTRQDLARFTALVQHTPLARVRASPVVWAFILEKAQRLQVADAAQQAREALALGEASSA